MTSNVPSPAYVDSLIHDGRKTIVHRFTVYYTCQREALEGNLRRAILDFMKTPPGKAMAVENGDDFNWGDACVGIPDDHWRKYGIIGVVGDDPAVVHLVVDHDENFYGGTS